MRKHFDSHALMCTSHGWETSLVLTDRTKQPQRMIWDGWFCIYTPYGLSKSDVNDKKTNFKHSDSVASSDRVVVSRAQNSRVGPKSVSPVTAPEHNPQDSRGPEHTPAHPSISGQGSMPHESTNVCQVRGQSVPWTGRRELRSQVRTTSWQPMVKWL